MGGRVEKGMLGLVQRSVQIPPEACFAVTTPKPVGVGGFALPPIGFTLKRCRVGSLRLMAPGMGFSPASAS